MIARLPIYRRSAAPTTTTTTTVNAGRWRFFAAVSHGVLVYFFRPRPGAVSEDPADCLAREVPVHAAALLRRRRAIAALWVLFAVWAEGERQREGAGEAARVRQGCAQIWNR